MEATNQTIAPTLDFKGKVICITGGSRGIGKSITQAFALLGAQCAINYRRDEQAANELIAELPGEHHRLYKADISSPENVASLIEGIIEDYGAIDVLINNAGMGAHHPIDQSDYAEWQKNFQHIMDVNFFSGANLCHCVAQHMIKRKKGCMINITSRGAFRGEPLQPAYGASKAAMNSLTQSLAYGLAPYNIFVGAVAPGFVETDMAKERLEGPRGDGIRNQSPLKRVAKPQEVAQAVVLMASSPIWMTGGIFDVNGASYFRT